MNVVPLLEDQILCVIACGRPVDAVPDGRQSVRGEVLLADARRLQQLIHVGDVRAAHRLAGGYPEGVLRTVPIRLDEGASAELLDLVGDQATELRKLGLENKQRKRLARGA